MNKILFSVCDVDNNLNRLSIRVHEDGNLSAQILGYGEERETDSPEYRDPKELSLWCLSKSIDRKIVWAIICDILREMRKRDIK